MWPPDRMHAIWTLPAGGADHGSRWRELKRRVTRLVGPHDLSGDGRDARWPHRYDQRRLGDDAELARPWTSRMTAQCGWAARARDGTYSSFHRHAADGRYSINWMEGQVG